MKLYAPKYYKKFKCIADKCAHSCCIGWEIDVNDAMLKKYSSLNSGYGLEIVKSISTEGAPHFKLCGGDRCPHLDEKGLCKIILNLGEDYLCDICREHPRFYNYSSVCEVGLGISCREAARIVLTSDDYDVIEEIGEIDGDPEELIYDASGERDRVYAILRDRSLEYAKRLWKIRSEYKIPDCDDEEALLKLKEMEYLDSSHREMFLRFSSKRRPNGSDEYLERALAYFIYRHCIESYDEEDFCARLSFCLFCEALLASLIQGGDLEEIVDLASIISEEIEYSEDNTELFTYC